MDDDPAAVAQAYSEIAGPLGDFSRTIELGPDTSPGKVLRDPAWLESRVRDTGRRWGHDDPRVNGTLWWYSASSSLVAAPLAMLLGTGRAPDPRPERLTVSLQSNGYFGAARSDSLLNSASEYSDALRESHAEIIAALAAVSGAAPRALWAIASDSVGNRALDAGRRGGRPRDGSALAEEITRPPLLPARFIDVEGPNTSRRFVRRSSCCLIYVATGGDKCVSCPRRKPAERHAELVRRTDS